MDNEAFDGILKGVSRLAKDGEPAGADSVLHALQRAVDEQARILERQGALIRRLRSELNGVEQSE